MGSEVSSPGVLGQDEGSLLLGQPPAPQREEFRRGKSGQYITRSKTKYYGQNVCVVPTPISYNEALIPNKIVFTYSSGSLGCN